MNDNVLKFPKFYKISEVAEKLNVHEDTVRRWISEKKYIDLSEIIKLKKSYLITVAEAERLYNLFSDMKRDIRKKEKSFTYFMQADEIKYIKIGTANNPKRRLKELQTALPFHLKLLAIDEEIDERIYHRKFAKSKKRGEWFHPSEDILCVIKALCDKS